MDRALVRYVRPQPYPLTDVNGTDDGSTGFCRRHLTAP